MTKFPICSVIISYDSTRAITVTKENDRSYFVRMFCLESTKETFTEQIQGNYIKLKEVEQNASGSQFCISYFDDGNFLFRHFGKETRT